MLDSEETLDGLILELETHYNDIIKKQDSFIDEVFDYYQTVFKNKKFTKITKEIEKQLIETHQKFDQNWGEFQINFKDTINLLSSASDLAAINKLFKQMKNNFIFIEQLMGIINNKDNNKEKQLENVILSNKEGDSTVIDLIVRLMMKGDSKKPALHIAVANNALSLVQYLVEKRGVDLNKTDKNGKAALHLAIRDENIVLLDYLLELGADPHIRDNRNTTTLMHAAYRGNLVIFNKLRDKQAQQVNINAQDKDGNTVLMYAAQIENLALVKAIVLILLKLELKSNINVQNKYGMTALAFAAQNGHGAIINFLLEEGANPNIITKKLKTTPLIVAAGNGHLDVVKKLVSILKVKIDTKDKDGMTALHLAVQGGHFDVVEVLVEAGADINLQDNKSNTALQIAAHLARNALDDDTKNKYERIVKFLLSEAKKNQELMQVIINNGDIKADNLKEVNNVNFRDNNGYTPYTLTPLQLY